MPPLPSILLSSGSFLSLSLLKVFRLSLSPIFYLFIKVLYAGELNPVGPKAQRKVPIPEGLDLDAWINEVMSIDLVCY